MTWTSRTRGTAGTSAAKTPATPWTAWARPASEARATANAPTSSTCRRHADAPPGPPQHGGGPVRAVRPRSDRAGRLREVRLQLGLRLLDDIRRPVALDAP